MNDPLLPFSIRPLTDAQAAQLRLDINTVVLKDLKRAERKCPPRTMQRPMCHCCCPRYK
jgi:hypothetical protein